MGAPIDPRPGPDATGPTPDDRADAGPLSGVDVGRRSFFRRMAGELVQGAATLTGVASVAQGAVDGASAAVREVTAGAAPVGADRATGSDRLLRDGLRDDVAPWVVDGDRRLVVDQRRLPGTLATFPVAGAPEAARAITERVVSGPSAAMIAAWALARTMEDAAPRSERARTALVTGARRSLLAADPGSHVLRWALGELDAAITAGAAPKDAAAALHDRLLAEHAHLAGLVGDLLDRTLGSGPPPVLLHGAGGCLWGAGAGITADAVLSRPVAVAEGRPWLDGARVLGWELGRRGVPHTLMTDAGAVGAVARGEVGAVLCAAERVAGDGSVSLPVGAMGLAVAAAHAQVPFLVVAASWALDPEGAPHAAALAEPPVPSSAVARVAGVQIVDAAATIDAARFEVVAGSLVAGLVGPTDRLDPAGTSATPRD